jgi:14-3-3 protein epsilon
MKRVVDASPVLTPEERDLISVAYKNAITGRRTGLRYLGPLLERDETKLSPFRVSELQKLQAKLRRELEEHCLDLIDVVDNKLLPATVDPAAQLYYLKLKADYWRYISEARDTEEKEQPALRAKEAYEKALQISQENIPVYKAAHLGLILNYSVYLYEIVGAKEQAITLAQKTYDEASLGVQNNSPSEVPEATNVLQLLRDNIALWTAQ